MCMRCRTAASVGRRSGVGTTWGQRRGGKGGLQGLSTILATFARQQRLQAFANDRGFDMLDRDGGGGVGGGSGGGRSCKGVDLFSRRKKTRRVRKFNKAPLPGQINTNQADPQPHDAKVQGQRDLVMLIILHARR